jgi:hypothetical protein
VKPNGILADSSPPLPAFSPCCVLLFSLSTGMDSSGYSDAQLQALARLVKEAKAAPKPKTKGLSKKWQDQQYDADDYEQILSLFAVSEDSVKSARALEEKSIVPALIKLLLICTLTW